ncbi:Hypothetical protein ETEE_1799 [Edwardsiella anguillarum ET080813]|uniref:Uncharacterized protein n=1 Tax=Edwardsiella anguillarum ET080813 TaxID=667120 RepID=A0A076LJW1_9GAMM|nr:Hypothetical protein ETEE_1799 [Edwardsiella anguillarum ET080813]
MHPRPALMRYFARKIRNSGACGLKKRALSHYCCISYAQAVY